MDTTAEYIEMCQKAEEIQGLRPKIEFNHYTNQFEDGDFVVDEYNEIRVYHSDSKGEGFIADEIIICWLPRQDQLQEMVIESKWWIDLFIDADTKDRRFVPQCEPYILFQEFINHCKWSYQKGNSFLTMEQSWLSFVMKKNFSKTWNPETKTWEAI